MSLNIEFVLGKKRHHMDIPRDNSFELLDKHCNKELTELLELITPLQSDENEIQWKTLDKLILIDAIDKLLNHIDQDKSLRVKSWTLDFDYLIVNGNKMSGPFKGGGGVSGLTIKDKEGYFGIMKQYDGQYALKQTVLSSDGTAVKTLESTILGECNIETETAGTVRIKSKKTKPELYFSLKKVCDFLKTSKGDIVKIAGDPL